MRPGHSAAPGLLALLYAAAFLVHSWPWARHFTTSFWCDTGDGLQNVWNLWWVRHALVEEGALPWFTRFLHFPHGTNLYGHTLNPWNGLVAAPLIPLLGLPAAHNLVVFGSFVATGVFMALLARHVSGSWGGAALAGFAFTFSGYHWAHAQGHLQLVSLQFVPLFLLCLLRLLEAPAVARGLQAGGVLGLVLLSDHYYFFFCALAAVLWLVMGATGLLGPRSPGRAHLAGLLALGAAGVLVAGPLVFALLTAPDPWIGAHDVRSFSADPLSLVVPGGHWRFADWTRFHWARVGDPNEHSVHVGVAALGLALAGATAPGGARVARRWLATGALFFVLSLGPALRVAGRVLTPDVLPYRWLEAVFPPLRLSGVPVRMTVMVGLAAAVLAAVGWARVVEGGTMKRRRAAVLLGALLIVELWPSPRPLAPAAVPAWASALRGLPGRGGLLVDLPLGYGSQLLAQTAHEKPMAGGFVARTPAGVQRATDDVLGFLAGRAHRRVQDLGFRYLVTERVLGTPRWREVWTDGRVRIYEAANARR